MDRARQTAVVCFVLLIVFGNKAGWLHLDLAALAIGDDQPSPQFVEPQTPVLPRLAHDAQPISKEIEPAPIVAPLSEALKNGIVFPDQPLGMRPHEGSLDYENKDYRICRVTAYHDRGMTASGVQSGIGQCAAPGDVPFGSKIIIPALGRSFIATDRTHRRFRNNTVDLFIPSREACFEFGVHYLEVIIIPPSEDAWPTRRRFVAAHEG